MCGMRRNLEGARKNRAYGRCVPRSGLAAPPVRLRLGAQKSHAVSAAEAASRDSDQARSAGIAPRRGLAETSTSLRRFTDRFRIFASNIFASTLPFLASRPSLHFVTAPRQLFAIFCRMLVGSASTLARAWTNTALVVREPPRRVCVSSWCVGLDCVRGAGQRHRGETNTIRPGTIPPSYPNPRFTFITPF